MLANTFCHVVLVVVSFVSTVWSEHGGEFPVLADSNQQNSSLFPNFQPTKIIIFIAHIMSSNVPFLGKSWQKKTCFQGLNHHFHHFDGYNPLSLSSRSDCCVPLPRLGGRGWTRIWNDRDGGVWSTNKHRDFI